MNIIIGIMLVTSIKFHPYHLIIKLNPEYNSIAVKNLKEVWDNGSALTLAGKELGIPEIDNLAKSYGLKEVKRLIYGKITEDAKLYGLDRYYLLVFENPIDAPSLVNTFSQITGIEIAEVDEAKPLLIEPNDPMYSQQWHLPKIQAPQGWDITKGDSTIAVGPVDSGVDWDHEDLYDKLWVNPGEDLNGNDKFDYPQDLNGVDDDGNGYVDDIIGFRFYPSQGWDPTPTENGNDHGTHVFGIAVATTDNGVGVAGVGWKVRGMAFKCGDGQYIYISAAVNAIYYAGNKGAVATNHSYGSYSQNSSERNAMIWAHDTRNVTICAAAGNDNIQTPHYPANYPNVIAVAATNSNDIKSSYSNYGTWIDVSSPGDNILSTVPNNGYDGFYGTSMASPVVCGIAGMVRSLHPGWTSYQTDSIIMKSCDDIDSLNPNYQGLLGWGRVNLYRALAQSIYSNIIVKNFQFDGDGRPEPGEVVKMYLNLYNEKYWQNANNINITVSTSDPNISFSDSTIYVASLQNGDSVLTTDFFEFSVSGNVRFSYFVINISSSPSTVKPVDTLKVLIGYPGLVLVDDGDNDYLRSFYESTLDNLGVVYETWIVDREGLHSFFAHPRNLFIWFTGNDSTEVLSTEEIDSLNAYLSSGGGLFISSQFLAEDADAQTFITNTLKTQIVGNDLLYRWIKGYGGDPIGDGVHLRITGTGGAQNAMDVDKITALSGADTSLYYSNSSGSANYGPCAVRYNSGTYKSLYFAFPFEAIDNNWTNHTTREELMAKILAWFGLNVEEKVKPVYQFKPVVSSFANDFLRVSGINGYFNVKIFDVMGRNIVSGTFNSKGDILIPVKSLPKGIYFIELKAGGKNLHSKFIRQ